MNLRRHFRTITLSFVIVLYALFAISYLLEGLLKLDFDLASIWQGVTLLVGVGGIGATYHFIDSKYNSPAGVEPSKTNEGDPS